MNRSNRHKTQTRKGSKADQNADMAAAGQETAAAASNGLDHPPISPNAARAPEGAVLAQNARPAQGLESEGSPVRVSPASTEPVKEKRGRRHKSFESIRRSYSAVANKVELGLLDPKQAAVIVQALNGLLATVGAMQAVELNEKAAQLEALAAGAEEAPVAGS